MNDPILDLIAQLPPPTVDLPRERRTQTRCHRILARRVSRHDVAWSPGWPSWSLATIGLGTLYLAEAVRAALHAFGVR